MEEEDIHNNSIIKELEEGVINTIKNLVSVSFHTGAIMQRDEIIKMASIFSCCPSCGSEDIGGHLCNKCNERYVEDDDAYWFAKLLKEKKTKESGEKFA